MEVHRIKEDAVTYIDLQDWEENMKESIYPLSTNILGRLQGLEGGSPEEGNPHGGYERLQILEESTQTEIQEVIKQT